MPDDLAERALAELGGVRHLTVRGLRPLADAHPREPRGEVTIALPHFEAGDKVATRVAFGKALVALGARADVVLDAEVGNSTRAEDFGKVHPERYFQTYIAEQQMIASAVAMAVRGYRPYTATFAAFLTRAHDFIRMAAISRVTVALSGSHSGVEIGADVPSQMGVEDLAMMRSVHGSTVLHPATPPPPRP